MAVVSPKSDNCGGSEILKGARGPRGVLCFWGLQREKTFGWNSASLYGRCANIFPICFVGPRNDIPKTMASFSYECELKMTLLALFLLGFGFLFFYRVFKAITKLPPLIIAMDFFLP